MAQTMRSATRSLDNAEYLNAPSNKCIRCGSLDTEFEDRIILNGHKVIVLQCNDCHQSTRTMLKDG